MEYYNFAAVIPKLPIFRFRTVSADGHDDNDVRIILYAAVSRAASAHITILYHIIIIIIFYYYIITPYIIYRNTLLNGTLNTVHCTVHNRELRKFTGRVQYYYYYYMVLFIQNRG